MRGLPVLLVVGASLACAAQKTAEGPAPAPGVPPAVKPAPHPAGAAQATRSDALPRGEQALLEGNHALARQWLLQAQREEGSAVQAGVLLAESHLQDDGDLGAAEGHLSRSLQKAPDHGRATFLLGRVREAQGRRGDAAVLYRKAVAAGPDNVEAYERLGSTALWDAVQARKVGDEDGAVRGYSEALEAFTRARQLSQDKPAYALGEAQAQEALGNLAAAEAALSRFQRLLPDSPGAHGLLADFYERHGQPEKALQERQLSGAAPKRKLRPLKPSR